ncbi:hypothetical protein [Modicisalibacter radicis]|uniref:hypothetical protein n=1 Tax=Halomonas sp. EAR18 TaxID=2518972 RepID=UPI00109CA377|nr:hypothetical protein [Halomonas sp. EAR18]
MNILSKLLSPVAAVVISALLPLTALAESDESQNRHGYGSHSDLNVTYQDETIPPHPNGNDR